MKISVLISNYNYEEYLRESIDSVLAQTFPAHEVIVVDDGSTDNSLDILRRFYAGNPQVKIISQSNQGQTSALATGIENASGEIVCLLDADDSYEPNYLAELAQHYGNRPDVDVTFCQFKPFGIEPYVKNEDVVFLSPSGDYDYGYTALLAYFGGIHYIGNLTSTISLRIRLARALDLRAAAKAMYTSNQGDYTVLLGASLLGGRKYYLHKALVRYRHHEKSFSRMWRRNETLRFRWWCSNQMRANYFKERFFLSDAMKWELPDEAGTIPAPMARHLSYYRKTRLLSLLPSCLQQMLRRWKTVSNRRRASM